MKKYLIFDSDHPLFRENKCFLDENKNAGCGHELFFELAERSKEKGFTPITSDLFLKTQLTDNELAYLVSDTAAENTPACILKGAIPFLNYCFESPYTARKYYSFVEKYNQPFHFSFQFKGTRKLLRSFEGTFESITFPTILQDFSPSPWNDRKFMVMLNANKQTKKGEGLKSRFADFAKDRFFQFLKFKSNLGYVKELYLDRVEALKHFSKFEDFELFGIGWDRPIHGLDEKQSEQVRSRWQGSNDYSQKLNTLDQFKFCLCFENCNFEGYVTEKIFDCFMAGTIPIYYGPIDKHECFPKDTFIDAEQFESMQELENYLNDFDSKKAEAYRKNAQNFLKSAEFRKFTNQHFIELFFSSIEKLELKLN